MGLSRNIFYASQTATPERLNTQGILIGQKTVVEISGTLCFCFILCHEKFGCSVFYWLYEKGHFVSIVCMAGIIRREIGLKRSLLTWFLVAFLSSCSATIEYHPFVGDEQVLKGSGGACDIANGVEIWIKGAPSKPFTVIGYIDGQYTEDIGEEAALKRLIAKKVKEVSGSGVIRTSRNSGQGDSYFFGNVLITDTDIKDEYIVFRYQ